MATMETFEVTIPAKMMRVAEDGSMQVLVTRWPNGQASIAVRSIGRKTWGPPKPMGRRSWEVDDFRG